MLEKILPIYTNMLSPGAAERSEQRIGKKMTKESSHSIYQKHRPAFHELSNHEDLKHRKDLSEYRERTKDREIKGMHSMDFRRQKGLGIIS